MLLTGPHAAALWTLQALEAVYGTDALVLAAGEQEALGLARLLVSQGVEADQLDRVALGISGILR